MASDPPKADIPPGYRQINGSERPRSSAAKLLGPLDPNEIVSVTLIIRHKPGSPALPDLQHWQDTPLGERQYLSPERYAEVHGASQADLDAVTSFAASHGLTVLSSHAGRRNVDISGTTAQMNAAFGIRLNRYESPRPSPKRGRPAIAEDGANSAVS